MQIEKFTTYRVSGNTYAFREELRRAGGRWDKSSQTWIVPVGGMNSIGKVRFALEQAQRGGCTIEKI